MYSSGARAEADHPLLSGEHGHEWSQDHLLRAHLCNQPLASHHFGQWLCHCPWDESAEPVRPAVAGCEWLHSLLLCAGFYF